MATVANLAQNKDNKSKIKVFPVEIVINEYNKNLLPGLTVSCRIIVDEIEQEQFETLASIVDRMEAYHNDYIVCALEEGFPEIEYSSWQDLSKRVIELAKEYNEALIHQVVVAYLANQRQGSKSI